MDKHTPGPWHTENGGDVFTALGATTRDGWTAADNDGWHIADCRPGSKTLDDIGDECELSTGEVLANACLVASAPDLLDALRVAYSDIQRCPGHTIDMLGRIEAAIDRATGEAKC